MDVHRTLVIACGALTRELRWSLLQPPLSEAAIDVVYLPANLHNRPEQIAPAVEALITEKLANYERIAVAYADCGTGGVLDTVLERYGVIRLPGAHCYEFFAGSTEFAALCEEEPGTFFLTDFLARQFDQLVMVGLGLDRHPELRDMYFGNYRRVVLLSQSDDPDLIAFGKRAAQRLDLMFEHRPTGMANFHSALTEVIELNTP
jgi:Protein of unknown function (DUF1638)